MSTAALEDELKANRKKIEELDKKIDGLEAKLEELTPKEKDNLAYWRDRRKELEQANERLAQQIAAIAQAQAQAQAAPFGLC